MDRRNDLAVAWRAFWVSRALVWAAALVAIAVFGVSSQASAYDPTGLTAPFGEPWDTLLAPAARWDSVWFLNIAADGYDAQRAAFFPLYPWLSAVVGLPLASTLLGGLVVSCVCAVAGLAAVHALARIELGDLAARHATWTLALFPGSIFLSTVYSEALFLALSAGALLAARTSRWGWAGVLGALACATRSAGIVLVVALALLWLDAQRDAATRRRPGLRELALGTAVPPLGLLAFCAFLALDGVGFRASFDAQEVWFREFAGPFVGLWDGLVAGWDGARQLLSGQREHVYFREAGGDPFLVAERNLRDTLTLLLFVVPATVGVVRRLRPAYAAYVVCALALPLSYPVGPQPLMSLPRFAAVLVPLFLWLGLWLAADTRRRAVPVYAVLAAATATFAGQFATWHFVA
ncbi:mannosyltransferase family protein [Conexibacter sp. SYSU D00693]|uniref:mannosyltransferase family protein n=1 Tax=Conexibacter sp. SYSU D00693 TaxID=2812560 RepID=UPI00196A7EEF|nr:mannosyltransferase family protein [Conexibacter sp. SYSU D00693]